MRALNCISRKTIAACAVVVFLLSSYNIPILKAQDVPGDTTGSGDIPAYYEMSPGEAATEPELPELVVPGLVGDPSEAGDAEGGDPETSDPDPGADPSDPGSGGDPGDTGDPEDTGTDPGDPGDPSDPGDTGDPGDIFPDPPTPPLPAAPPPPSGSGWVLADYSCLDGNIYTRDLIYTRTWTSGGGCYYPSGAEAQETYAIYQSFVIDLCLETPEWKIMDDTKSHVESVRWDIAGSGTLATDKGYYCKSKNFFGTDLMDYWQQLKREKKDSAGRIVIDTDWTNMTEDTDMRIGHQTEIARGSATVLRPYDYIRRSIIWHGDTDITREEVRISNLPCTVAGRESKETTTSIRREKNSTAIYDFDNKFYRLWDSFGALVTKSETCQSSYNADGTLASFTDVGFEINKVRYAGCKILTAWDNRTGSSASIIWDGGFLTRVMGSIRTAALSISYSWDTGSPVAAFDADKFALIENWLNGQMSGLSLCPYP